jgi:hypothetical protein
MPKYLVTINRTRTENATVEADANSRDEAERIISERIDAAEDNDLWPGLVWHHSEDGDAPFVCDSEEIK